MKRFGGKYEAFAIYANREHMEGDCPFRTDERDAKKLLEKFGGVTMYVYSGDRLVSAAACVGGKYVDLDVYDGAGYTGEYCVGDVIDILFHENEYEVEVLSVWSDEGRNGVTVEPEGFDFPVDIYEDDLELA